MMIEKIADAVKRVWDEWPGAIDAENVGEVRLAAARAAIKAMRNPTKRMLDAGEGYNLRCGCPACDHENWEKTRAGWQAMIDEALR